MREDMPGFIADEDRVFNGMECIIKFKLTTPKPTDKWQERPSQTAVREM
jgi:hypothetical protein